VAKRSSEAGDWRPRKIISGGQTGVDRAALDAAIALGIPHGGWCPRGRLAEDGPIPDRYELRETESSDYPARTERNVLDSDATLILCPGQPAGGTELTVRLARRHRRPCLVVDLDRPLDAAKVRRWLRRHKVAILNVAGPRESQSPGVAQRAIEFLHAVFG
jgi:predicted Rossmann-fold nucleotide-binding protein